LDTVRFRTVLIFLCFVGFLLPATGVIVPARASTYQSHSSITIDGNAGFTSANGVTGGSGTLSDPYIIQGWDINASGLACCNAYGNAGLVIEHTNASFIVRNVYVHQGLPLIEGIILHQVSTGSVENSVTSNDWAGIAVDSSTNVTVTGNTVYSDNPYGIYLYQTASSRVSGNNVYSNQNAGIFLYSSNNVTVNNNLVHDQVAIGIDTYTTQYDTFVANNVSNNGWIGIRLLYSDYNLVYHNNLVTNGQNPPPYNQGGIQVMDSPSSTGTGYNPPQNTTNRWDDGYPTGGNYYSDGFHLDYCSGPGQNICNYPDGINDGPYWIRSEYVYCPSSLNCQPYFYYIAKDNYPLAKPFSITTTTPDFQISSSSSPTFSPGSSATVTVTLASIQNYASQITISTSTDAPNTNISPSTTGITLNPSSQVNTTLTLSASSNTALGTYYLDIKANYSSLSHTTTVTLNILPASQSPPTQPSQKPTNAAPPGLAQLTVLLPIVTAAAIASVFTVLVWARKKSRAEKQVQEGHNRDGRTISSGTHG
jgi:parallel beta-helix repeat protein